MFYLRVVQNLCKNPVKTQSPCRVGNKSTRCNRLTGCQLAIKAVESLKDGVKVSNNVGRGSGVNTYGIEREANLHL